MSFEKGRGKLSAEKLAEERKRRMREYAKQRRQSFTPEQRQLEREKKARRLSCLTPEQIAERKKIHAERERLRRSGLTPEKFAEMRKKHAENERLRRSGLPPEKFAEMREKHAENERLRKAGAGLTPLEMAQRRKTHAEYERLRRAQETPEQMAERRKKHAEYERLRKASQTPEAREERLRKRRFRNFEKVATMTDEERKEYEVKKFFEKQAYSRKYRFKDWPEERKKQAIMRLRERTSKLTGEARKRYLEDSCRRYKKWISKMKEENPERWNEYQRKRREALKKANKKHIAEETPEERQRRLHRYRVNAAARKLKQRLVDEQIPEDEIDTRLVELKTAMWREFDPDYDKRPRKPVGRRRKATPPPLVNEEAVRVLGREEDGNLNKVHRVEGGENSQAMDDCLPLNEEDECTDLGEQNVDYEERFSPCTSPVASPQPSLPPTPTVLIYSTRDPIETTTPTLQCLHCPSVFRDDTLLRTHICAAHSNKCWKCPKCKEVVLSPLELSQHYKSSHIKTVRQEGEPSFRFVCMRCCPSTNVQLRNFRTRLDLFFHVKAEHPEHYWPCNYCNLLKYSQKSLKVHMGLCRLFKNAEYSKF